MSLVNVETDRVICHCLGVTASQIREGVTIHATESVREVMQCTRAGSGCTACHARIRAILTECGVKGQERPTRVSQIAR